MKTESIAYMGSKNKLLSHILEEIKNLGATRVLDGFAGSCRVGQALRLNNIPVISNDINIWSAVLGTCYLVNYEPIEHYVEMIEELNACRPISGWLTEKYGGMPVNDSKIQVGDKRMWQIHNTKKADAIREKIDIIASNQVERAVLITALMLSLDRVGNAIGHQASFLREWQPKSYKKIRLLVPELIVNRNVNNLILYKDIFQTIEDKRYKYDVAYFDPPYGGGNNMAKGTRVRYRAYYNIWTSICLNDKPETFGVANRREDSRDKTCSVFEAYKKMDNGKPIAQDAMERLLVGTTCKHIILSYNNNGYVTPDDIKQIATDNRWNIKTLSFDHKLNAQAYMNSTKEWTKLMFTQNKEFLFIITK